jgi:biotin synthase-like enzyme
MGDVLPAYFFECIETIKENTDLDVTATFGAISRSDLLRLQKSGIDRISCAIETTNQEVFKKLKPGDSFNARLGTLRTARELGLRTSTNFLIGIGESIEDIDDTIRTAKELDVEFLSVSSLQPTPFTETEKWERPRPYLVAKVAAAARIIMPEADITTSFGCDSYSDLAWGMRSGANAFTVALRSPEDRPELMGDETGRIHVMWDQYRTEVTA